MAKNQTKGLRTGMGQGTGAFPGAIRDVSTWAPLTELTQLPKFTWGPV